MKNLRNIFAAALVVSLFGMTSCSNCSAYGCYSDASESKSEVIKKKMELKQLEVNTLASCTP